MTSQKPAAPLAIITVTYSPGEYLGRFLDSLAGENVTVVLADNGSTDGAPEAAAERYPFVTFLPTGGNLGYGAAINAAARSLAGADVDREFLLVANPDVEFTPGAIDALLDCARRHPTAGAVGPAIVSPDGSAYPSARAVPTLGNGIGHALLGWCWPNNPFSRAYRANEAMDQERTAGWLSGSCLLLRREAFERVGGFDERYFMYLEDVDLGDRLARAGWENVFCPQAVISHAQGHSANAHRSMTLPAHHRSAYRFLADRYPAWWQAPLRWVLAVGLRARGRLATLVAAAKAAS